MQIYCTNSVRFYTKLNLVNLFTNKKHFSLFKSYSYLYHKQTCKLMYLGSRYDETGISDFGA